jgi:alpha-soluble NSF attachment protein
VADLAALAGQYQRAIERYESVARASLNSNLTKWSVKDYFFKAGACYLANKVDTHNIARFLILRTLFPRNQPSNGSSSRILHLRQRGNAFSYKYIFSLRSHLIKKDLTGAIEAADEDVFLDKLQAYDQMSKLDKWKTAMFLKVKEGIDAEPDLT